MTWDVIFLADVNPEFIYENVFKREGVVLFIISLGELKLLIKINIQNPDAKFPHGYYLSIAAATRPLCLCKSIYPEALPAT
jgi:hypothetical protein